MRYYGERIVTGILCSMVAGGIGKEVPTVIGQAFGGGYYVGQISTTGNNVATHYLIVAPVSSGQTTAQWKTTDSNTVNTSSVIDGPANSANMNNTAHPAAYFCEGLTIGNYDDWYLPSIAELEICYYNLKPSTYLNETANAKFTGGTYAVPQRFNTYYTSTVPAQTSATIFKSGGQQAFASDLTSASFYYSSTQATSDSARALWFLNGVQDSRYKPQSYKVRAVRRIPV